MRSRAHPSVADLHVVADNDERVDVLAAESAVKDLLQALGRDVTEEDLRDTPRRVANAWEELLTPRPFELTTFANSDGYEGLVVSHGIPFSSICAHHLLPFFGVVSVGYAPGDRLLGLSKLARVVEQFSRDLQIQERLTAQVAGFLQDSVQPLGVGVFMVAEHLCMTLRGVQARGTTTTTSSFLGTLREGALRDEFLRGVPKHP
jgi:GTP cyclohydrolase I